MVDVISVHDWDCEMQSFCNTLVEIMLRLKIEASKIDCTAKAELLPVLKGMDLELRDMTSGEIRGVVSCLCRHSNAFANLHSCVDAINEVWKCRVCEKQLSVICDNNKACRR